MWSQSLELIWNEHDLVIAYGRAEGEPKDKDKNLPKGKNYHSDSEKKWYKITSAMFVIEWGSTFRPDQLKNPEYDPVLQWDSFVNLDSMTVSAVEVGARWWGREEALVSRSAFAKCNSSSASPATAHIRVLWPIRSWGNVELEISGWNWELLVRQVYKVHFQQHTA